MGFITGGAARPPSGVDVPDDGGVDRALLVSPVGNAGASGAGGGGGGGAATGFGFGTNLRLRDRLAFLSPTFRIRGSRKLENVLVTRRPPFLPSIPCTQPPAIIILLLDLDQFTLGQVQFPGLAFKVVHGLVHVLRGSLRGRRGRRRRRRGRGTAHRCCFRDPVGPDGGCCCRCCRLDRARNDARRATEDSRRRGLGCARKGSCRWPRRRTGLLLPCQPCICASRRRLTLFAAAFFTVFGRGFRAGIGRETTTISRCP